MDNAEVMTVLPKELRLGAPPTMPQARSYMFRQQSTLSAYNPEDQIQINVPRLQRSYLRKDSYLQFRLNGQYQPDLQAGNQYGQFQFTPDLLLDDAGAWGLFERIEIFDYLGSTVLESIDGLPQLMSLLLDMGTEVTDSDHEGQVSQGLQQQYTSNFVRDNGARYELIGGVLTGISVGTPFVINAGANTMTFIINNVTRTATIAAGSYTSGAALINALNAGLGPVGLVAEQVAGSSVTADNGKLAIFGYTPSAWTLSANAMTALGFGTPPQVAALPTNTNVNARFSAVASNAGIGLPFYQGGMPLVMTTVSPVTQFNQNQDFSVQFSIPLPSFLGFLSKKMVPLHNGFTIVLTLATQYKPVFIAPIQTSMIIFSPTENTIKNTLQNVAVSATNTREPSSGNDINGPQLADGTNNWKTPSTFWWQVTDVNLVCQVLELGPVAESMILSSTQGQPLIVHTKQMRYYRGASSKSQSEFYLPLNLNVASLTNILWFMRPNGIEDDIRYQSCGGRHRNFLQRWEFQYGSTTMPQSNGISAMSMTQPTVKSGFNWNSTTTGITNASSECFSELLKARPCQPHKGRLTYYNYSQQTKYPGISDLYFFAHTPWKEIDVGGNESAVLPKFACGLTTELVSGKDDLICGLNTNGMNTQIRAYFHPSYLTNAQKLDVIVDAYAEYDAFINISPGIASTVSF